MEFCPDGAGHPVPLSTLHQQLSLLTTNTAHRARLKEESSRLLTREP